MDENERSQKLSVTESSGDAETDMDADLPILKLEESPTKTTSLVVAGVSELDSRSPSSLISCEENSVETPVSPYQYCSLPSRDSIRLIALLPGKDSDPIYCSLSTVDLKDAPPFEALSYVWGNPRNAKSIFCCDHDNISQLTKSTLHVTVNCWHALLRLRHESQTRNIWIDAICINQRDLKERDQQVTLMGNLYRRATCVPVYLGHDEKDDEHLPKVFELFKALALKAASFPKGVPVSAFADIELSLIKSFCKFFERPWFHRCWTMQEIGLARRSTLLCDGDELEWDVFFSVICWINQYQSLDKIHLDLPTEELATSVILYTAFENGDTSAFTSQPDFLDVLNATRHRQAGDPQDHIYAFLGHATAVDREGPLVVPYYSQWSWIVFYKFTLTYLKRTHNLRILSTVYHGKALPPPQFPLSWVPWWNPSPYLCNFGLAALYDASAGAMECRIIHLGGTIIEDLDIDQVLEDSYLVEWEDLIMSSTGSKESIEGVHQRFLSNMFTRQMSQFSLDSLSTVDRLLDWHQPDEAILSVSGLILDEVQLVWQVLDKTDFTMHSFSYGQNPAAHFVEALYDILQKDDFISQYEDPLLALSLTLAAGVHGSNLAQQDLAAHQASFAAYRRIIKNYSHTQLAARAAQNNDDTTDSGTKEEIYEQIPPTHMWQDFMFAAVNACHKRRFFTTTSGFFGLGPEALLSEGMAGKAFVAILFGARAPFILQKREGMYRLVGEAYVHGVMHGEAVQRWERGELEAVELRLF